MAWGKVDDKLAFHPKVIVAGNEAMGLWVRALSYCCDHLTDGFVSDGIVAALGGEPVASKLEEAGLWIRVEAGFEFKDWAEFQPSGDAVREHKNHLSKVRSEAGRKGMSQRWDNKTDSKRDNKPITKGITNAYQTDNPVPVPVPNTTSKEVVLTRENENEKLFEQFWAVWPKRVDKGRARKAWLKALKKADAETIIGAAAQYAASPFRPEMQFVPMPATWLNGERWLDDAPVPAQVVTKAQKNLSTVAYFEQVDRLAVEA